VIARVNPGHLNYASTYFTDVEYRRKRGGVTHLHDLLDRYLLDQGNSVKHTQTQANARGGVRRASCF
jgi:hypothetical protein